MHRASRLDPVEIDRLRALPLSYPEVGATYGALPAGYHHLSVRRPLRADRFARASAAVLGWRMHRGAGVGVRASAEPVVADAVAVLRLGVGPLGVDAPVRVVRVIDEQRRQGFVYGTLPGHPERGEEEFVVETDGERVWLSITAFSRPATLLTRAGGPVGRVVQGWVTERYARAVREA